MQLGAGYLAGAAARADGPLVAQQQRGRLDHLGFYAAYMVSVPVLVTLTDRIDAKRVYLFGVGCTMLAHFAFGLSPTASGRRSPCARWPASAGPAPT